MVVVRRARVEDCKPCQDISNTPELQEATKEPPIIWWVESLAKEGIFFVAEEGNDIVGYVAGERTAGDIAMLHLMAVKNGHQDKGVGKMLLKSFEDECKKNKLKAIFLYGSAGNEKTLSFFGKSGYEKGTLTHEFLKFL